MILPRPYSASVAVALWLAGAAAQADVNPDCSAVAQVSESGRWAYGSVVSPDGRRILYMDNAGRLMSARPDGLGGPIALIEGSIDQVWPVLWSNLAVGIRYTGGWTGHVYSVPLCGGVPPSLLSPPAWGVLDFLAVDSARGWLAFARRLGEDRSQPYLVPARGGVAPRLLVNAGTVFAASGYDIAFSRDGSCVVFSGRLQGETRSRLWVARTDGNTPAAEIGATEAAHGVGGFWILSRTRRVVFSTPGEAVELWVASLDGNHVPTPLGTGSYLGCSADEDWLFARQGDTLLRRPADGSGVAQTLVTAAGIMGVQVSPDAAYLLFWTLQDYPRFGGLCTVRTDGSESARALATGFVLYSFWISADSRYLIYWPENGDPAYGAYRIALDGTTPAEPLYQRPPGNFVSSEFNERTSQALHTVFERNPTGGVTRQLFLSPLGADGVPLALTEPLPSSLDGDSDPPAHFIGDGRFIRLRTGLPTSAVINIYYSSADLAATLTGPAVLRAGASAAWQVAVSNRGPCAAVATELTLPAPAGADWSTPSGAAATCDGGTLRLRAGDLAAGMATSWTPVLTVRASSFGMATVQVSAACAAWDPDYSNNVAASVLAESAAWSSRDVPRRANGSSPIVSGLLVPAGARVGDLDVSLHLTQGRNARGSLYLVSPRGVAVPLLTGRHTNGRSLGIDCGSAADRRLTFDDQSPYRLEDTVAPFVGSYQTTARQLSRFNGQPAAGWWWLVVQGADRGATLDCWSLAITPAR